MGIIKISFRWRVFFCVCLLVTFGVCTTVQAEQLFIDGKLSLAATQCSDNTEVYVTRNSFLAYSNIYVLKDSKLIFAAEENDEINPARDILCLRHGIVVFAEHGGYFKTLMLQTDHGKVSLKTVGTDRGPGRVSTSLQKTTIATRDLEASDQPQSEKTVQFETVFSIPSTDNYPSLTIRPHVSEYISDKDARLTALSRCSLASGESYFAESYRNKEGIPYVLCYSEFGKREASRPLRLPFVATSGVCDETSRHYLFGQSDKKLQAVEIVFDKGANVYRLESRDAETIPLQPYLPAYNEDGPAKPLEYPMEDE